MATLPEIPAPPVTLNAPSEVNVGPVTVCAVTLVTVVTPETLRISSIVVVPPAESIIKFPVDVSISLSAVIPILTLSIIAPPLPVI